MLRLEILSAELSIMVYVRSVPLGTSRMKLEGVLKSVLPVRHILLNQGDALTATLDSRLKVILVWRMMKFWVIQTVPSSKKAFV